MPTVPPSNLFFYLRSLAARTPVAASVPVVTVDGSFVGLICRSSM
jgi:hypothetical protein